MLPEGDSLNLLATFRKSPITDGIPEDSSTMASQCEMNSSSIRKLKQRKLRSPSMSVRLFLSYNYYLIPPHKPTKTL